MAVLAPSTQHFMSLGRVLLGAVVLTELWKSSSSWLVLPCVLLACWLDYADGHIARAHGEETTGGRLIDNVSDAAFLALCFWGFASVDVWSDPVSGSATRYWEYANWLPLIMLLVSFGTYMLRWYLSALLDKPLAPSLRGHSAGVFNYVLAIVGGVAVIPGFTLTPWLVEPAFVTVALLNATAASDNLMLLASLRRRP